MKHSAQVPEKFDIWKLYGKMYRSRLFEEKCAELWRQGLISGELHSSCGEEAIAAGVTDHLLEGDSMALDHRGTAPLISRGFDITLLMKELLGRSDGLCKGMGGHMHLFSKDDLVASSGIVGAAGPLASGFALAARYLHPGNLAVAFFGEGALNQGMLLESFNLAAAWKLPVLFICKDSSMAIATYSPSVTGGIPAERIKGFGIPVDQVDGLDVEKVWHSAQRAVRHIRSEKGPYCLLAPCVHMDGHFLGDPLLRIVDHPFHEVRNKLGPLAGSIMKAGGASFRKRIVDLGRIASLIGKAAGQKKNVSDPVWLTRQKLLPEKERLDSLEKEILNQVGEAANNACGSRDEARQ